MGAPAPGPARSGAGARNRWRPVGVLALALLLFALPSGFAPSVVAPPRGGGAEPVPTMVAEAALAAASGALDRGAGPAGGRTVSCSDAGYGAASCSLPVAGVPNATSPGNWVNLTAVEPTAPSARALGNMVWDARDGYVLWLGGCSIVTCNGVPFGDTWIFQNDTWRELSGPEPPARSIAQMAYDPIDREVVLFGGLASGVPLEILGDTWVFAGGLWTNLTGSLTVAPSPRYRGMMAFDAHDGYVLMFGGTGSNSATVVPYAQTWKFVNQTWTNLTTLVSGHPTGRYRGAMAYDAADGYVVLYGGCTSVTRCPTRDTWTYENLTWTNLTAKAGYVGPSPRVYPAMSWDARDDCILLFGGNESTALGAAEYHDTWVFSGGKWINETVNVTHAPSSRGEGEMAEDPADNLTVMFGGFDNAVGLLAETFTFGPFLDLGAVGRPAVVDVGQRFTVSSIAAAADGSTISYAYQSNPPSCASVNASTWSCAAPSTGVWHINVTAQDPHDDVAAAAVNATVDPDPVITAFSADPATVTVGIPFALEVSASSGTPGYSYAYRGLPAGCAGANASSVRCTPTGSGSFTIEAEVTDSVGFSVYANASVVVNAKPGITAFTASPPLLDRGQETQLTVDPAGGTAPLSYAYAGLPGGCVSANTSELECRPTAVGSSSISVNVTDADGVVASANLSLVVNPALALRSDALSSTTIDRGMTFTLWLNVSGGTAPYLYNYSLPTGCASANVSTISCRPGSVGTFDLFAEATDLVGENVSAAFVVTVVGLPTVTAFTTTAAALDVGVTTNLSTRVSGGVAPFAFTYRDLPAGCASQNLSTLPCTPLAAGGANVEVVATDRFGYAADANLSLVVNADPAIVEFAASPVLVPAGGTLFLNVTASGGTGALVYSYAELPTGCASANRSALACAPTESGNFTSIVTVRDGDGRNASARVSYEVASPRPGAKGSGGGGALSSDWGWIGLGALLLLLLVLAVVLLARRRRPPAAPVEASPSEPTAPPAVPAWDENAP